MTEQADFLASETRWHITTKELAEFLDVAPRTIQHLNKQEGLPRY